MTDRQTDTQDNYCITLAAHARRGLIMPDDIEKGMLNVCIILSPPPLQPHYEVLGMRMNNEDGH